MGGGAQVLGLSPAIPGAFIGSLIECALQCEKPVPQGAAQPSVPQCQHQLRLVNQLTQHELHLAGGAPESENA